jgi:hypothetical protein
MLDRQIPKEPLRSPLEYILFESQPILDSDGILTASPDLALRSSELRELIYNSTKPYSSHVDQVATISSVGIAPSRGNLEMRPEDLQSIGDLMRRLVEDRIQLDQLVFKE